MRMSHLAPLAIVVALAACSDSSGITNTPGPLAYVRYVHAMPDTGSVDVHLVDKVENVDANAVSYGYVSPFQGIAAGDRHFRVFTDMGSTDPAVVTQVILDTTITLQPQTYYTILHTGYARTGQSPKQHFQVIQESFPAIPSGKMAIRTIVATPNVNGGSSIDVYAPRKTGDPTPAAPILANVVYGTPSVWAQLGVDTLAVRATQNATTTQVAQGAMPIGAAAGTMLDPAAGSTQSGSGLTAFVFGPGIAGSPAASKTTAFVSFGVDVRPPRP